MYIFIYFIRNDGLIMQYITLLPNNWISDQFGITTTQTLHLQSLQITFKKKNTTLIFGKIVFLWQ